MYRNILVVTDGSELSSKAVKAALRLGRDFQAEILVLNVQAPYQPPIAGEVPAAFLHNPEEYEQLALENSRKVLDEVAQQAAELGAKCRTLTRFDHSVHQSIINTAKDERIDLIVMASHGRGGFKNLLLGSETQKVLTNCRIPVLVHR